MDRRRFLGSIGGLATVAASAGCSVPGIGRRDGSDWRMPGFDATGAGYRPDGPDLTAGLRSDWTHDFREHDEVRSPPVVHDGTVFAAAYGDPVPEGENLDDPPFRLWAIDGADGSRRWELDRWRPVEAGITVADGLVYAGGVYDLRRRTPSLDAIAVADGSVRWRAEFPREDPVTVGPPTVVDGTAYLTAGDRAYALDAGSGDRIWRADLGAEALGGQPLVVDGAVHVATAAGTLRAIGMTDGERRWEWDLGTSPAVRPIATDDVVVLGDETRLVAVDDGSVRWRFGPRWEVTSWRPAADGERVVVSTYDPNRSPAFEVIGVAVVDGRVAWRTGDVPTTRVPPTVVGGTALLGKYRGRRLTAVDVTDGSVHWRRDLPGPLLGRPVVADGRCYVPTSFGATGGIAAFLPE